MSAKPVYSLSISGRMTLELHSLNNEGGEGNQTMTRTVTLVDPAGGIHKVNAISGDMFKHIQAEHFYRLARERGLSLCSGCQIFRSDRILGDGEFIKGLPAKDEDAVNALLQHCALDDAEGTLIASRNRSIPRKSVAEFSWVVGLPEKVRTESYFHVRYAQERGGEGEEAQAQPIFHRPASSGIYAAVATFELARIGFNDISQTYAIAEEERLRRYRTFLESILYTFIEPNGAMRGTQNPHIVAFDGVITVSNAVLPAPTISPLGEGYQEQVQQVAQALDRDGGRLQVHLFANMAEFATTMRQIIDGSRPYRLFGENGG
ncbi:MAG: DevR family CRISPR-associated autoregulator [Anaerolineae bacterium]|jgi:CRISPR-associated protein Cst2|nr:DevR family CRISPR-associated autoregulator [Anaerolineae bacterium]MDH7475131.1 DevR family CRISPR-associated autoregulator [Anaerolineae bacterium]